MDAKNKKRNVPVKPYDDSMWERYSIYDKIPYVWDADLNTEKTFNTISGNIIKSYRCKFEEPYEVKHE
ncbi:MAG: hypothetical protein PHF63_13255 [Herbinix sp.]|nr:hypothetical protein [Herbinix sp.]